MNDILIGILLSIFIIFFLEIFNSFDKKLISVITLVGIAFIYIGFSWQDIYSLFIVVLGIFVFTSLAYFGYTYKYNLIISGFILHGIWDFVFPYFSSTAPVGYDKFCITVDFILAIYFYIRVANKP